MRLAAVGGLLCGALMVTTAVASEPAPHRQQAEGPAPPAELGAHLVARLGDSRTAGTWVGADGRPVVAVTDEDAAAEAERAGARAKVVSHSMRRLRTAVDALREAPRVPGTAWAMDYAANRVVVQADSTVAADDWSRMARLAERIGGHVHMERTTGTLTTRLNGADPVFSRSGRCSAGFNVTDGRRDFILTAGHCGPPGTDWSEDARGTRPVGTTTAGRFPGADFSLVAYEDPGVSGVSGVVSVGGGRGVRITGAADPYVGQEVFRSGATTGVRSGRVTAVDVTVNYPEGTVTGLVQATTCAEPGDSGGPLFADGQALGVTSGGTGDCAEGGVTFFQPVTAALAALGVTLTGTAPAPDGGGVAAAPPYGAGAGEGAGAQGPVGPVGGPGGAAGPGAFLGVRETLVPGLLVIAVSLVVLVAGGFIRTAHDRRSYRREYSRAWS